MDGRAATAFNHQALQRIVAGLVAMAGMGESPPLRGRCPAGQRGVGAELATDAGAAPTSPLRDFEARPSDRAGGSIVGREGRDAAGGSGDPACDPELAPEFDAAPTSPLWGGRRVASGGGRGAEDTPTRRSGDRRPPHKGEVGPSRWAEPAHPSDGSTSPDRPLPTADRRLTLPRHLRLEIGRAHV